MLCRRNKIFSQILLNSNCLGEASYATFNRPRVIAKDEAVQPKKGLYFNAYEKDLQNYVKTSPDLSDLVNFKEKLLTQYKGNIQFNAESFDAVFIKACLACRDLEKASAYMKYLRENGLKVNTPTLSKYIKLCYLCPESIINKEEIEQLCAELKSHSNYLDAASLESLILGLSLTDKWKEGLELLTEHEDAQTTIALNAIVSKLVNTDQLVSALSWMEKMMRKERAILDTIYDLWANKCSKSEEAWKLLTDFLSRHQVFISQAMAEKFKEMFEKKASGSFRGKFTQIEKITGRCRSCRKAMKAASISPIQFETLKKNLLEKVLLGADVYKGSNPEELNKFYGFIEKNAPFDVVIDGLNVAYFAVSGSGKTANIKKLQAINAVVKYLRQENYTRILVLGRKHMLGWSSHVLKELKANAHVFLTENLSKDDPFLLYAALQDQKTKFISDDLFRDHLYRLADYDLQSLFRLWQRNAQLQLVDIRADGSIVMEHPLPYRTVTQLNDGCWHIPYDDGSPRYSYQLPNNWLCLQPEA